MTNFFKLLFAVSIITNFSYVRSQDLYDKTGHIIFDIDEIQKLASFQDLFKTSLFEDISDNFAKHLIESADRLIYVSDDVQKLGFLIDDAFNSAVKETIAKNPEKLFKALNLPTPQELVRLNLANNLDSALVIAKKSLEQKSKKIFEAFDLFKYRNVLQFEANIAFDVMPLKPHLVEIAGYQKLREYLIDKANKGKQVLYDFSDSLLDTKTLKVRVTMVSQSASDSFINSVIKVIRLKF